MLLRQARLLFAGVVIKLGQQARSCGPLRVCPKQSVIEVCSCQQFIRLLFQPLGFLAMVTRESQLICCRSVR